MLSKMERPTMRPMVLGCFVLTETGVNVKGAPEFEDFADVIRRTEWMHRCSGLWLADLLVYAESRKDWEGLIDSVIDNELLTEGSTRTYVAVAKAVPPERRVPGVGFGHTQKVAGLAPEEQTAMLVKARDEHLTVAELETAIRSHRSGRVLEAKAGGVADLEQLISDTAWLAQQACRQIAHNRYRDADQKIADARLNLEKCEKHVAEYRKLTEKPK